MSTTYCLNLTQHDVNTYKSLIEKGYKPAALTAFIYSWQKETLSDRDVYPTLEQLENHIKETVQKTNRIQKLIKSLPTALNQGQNTETPEFSDEEITRLYKLGVRAESKDPVERRENFVKSITNPQTRIDRAYLVYQFFLELLQREQHLAALQGTTLNYKEALDKLSNGDIKSVFERIKSSKFLNYILNEDFEKQSLVQAFIKNGLSEEQAVDRAEKVYNKKVSAYVDILNNYTTLCEDTCNIIYNSTKIRIKLNNNTSRNAQQDTVDDDIFTETYDMTDDEDRMSVKDNTYNSYNETSHQDTLSNEVRMILSNLNSVILLSNGKTKLDRDDLGRIRKVDMGDVHAVLINLLRHCIDANDIIPTLQRNVKKYPWISQLLDVFTVTDSMTDAEVNTVDSIFTAFAVDMIGAWVGYIHESVSKDGSVKTSNINHSEDYSYWIDRWEKIINGNTVLTSDKPFTFTNNDKEISIESVYDGSGKYSIDRIEAVLFAVQQAANSYKGTREAYNKTSKEELEFSKNNIVDAEGEMLQHTRMLYESLRAIGIDISEASFINAVQDVYFEQVEKDGEIVERAHEPFLAIASNVTNILKALKTNLNADSNDNIDLYSMGKTGYYRISRYFISEIGDLAEMSFRENGKTRYAHIKDNFIFRFLKKIKNLNKDKPVPAQFKDKYATYFDYFIGEEYQKYPFFYKNGEFGIRVLELLKNNPEFREKFDINIVLTQGKKEVSDLSDYEMLLSMIAQFSYEEGQIISKEEEKAANERGYGYARYYLPLPAEAGVGYVMTLPKYHNIEEIKQRFSKVIEQEINRILDVIHRDRLFRKYNPETGEGLNPETNMQDCFDIVRDKDGNIKDYGGAEFKFFTGLNDKVEVYVNGNEVIRIDDSNRENYDSTAIINLPKIVVALLEGDIESNDDMRPYYEPYLESEFSKFLQEQTKLGISKYNKNGMVPALGVESSVKERVKTTIEYLNNLNNIRRLTENNYMYEGNVADADLLRNSFEYLINIVNGVFNTDYRATMAYANYENSTQSVPNLITSINVLLYTYLKGVVKYDNNKKVSYSESENMNYHAINSEFVDKIIPAMKNLTSLLDKFNQDYNYYEKTKQERKLESFFYNWSYAQVEMIELITGDLAQYKDYANWVKRAKEYHANGDRLNINAKWNGKPVSDDGYERMVIAKDQKIPSQTLTEIGAILDKHISNPIEKEFALSEFRGIVGTDAQTLRTLPSCRKIAIMHHDWDDKKEASYNRIVNGTWTFEDFQLIIEAVKPYVFTHITDSWTDENGEEHLQKRSLQIKTAESVMLTMYAALAGEGNNSKQIENLNRFMVDNNIDILCFESAIKVGGKSKIDISDLSENYDEAKKYLSDVINSETTQVIDLNDMVIQHPIPEHFEDATQLLGTQIKKLILADTNPETKIYISGLQDKIVIMGEEVDCSDGIAFKDVIRFYQELLTDQMLDSFKDVCGQFKTVEDLAKVLQEHIQNSATFSPDLLNAVQLVIDPNTGKKTFNIPLHDNIIKNKVENVLHAICKQRIIQQTIAGGTCTQISSFAYTDKLKIVFKDGNNRVLKKESDFASKEEYDQYVKDNISAIAYVECYAPCFNSKLKDYLQQFTSKDGILDINNIPEQYRDEICKCIGYRIPTEDKYSMIPLKIIGFLPSTLSSSIMLPLDWVAISGSDFDADKLYMMVKELEEDNEMPSEWVKWMLKNDADLQNLTGDDRTKYLLKAWELGFKSMKPIKYDTTKSSDNQSKDAVKAKKARNNMIVNLYEGILTNPDCAANVLNPGNFNEQKKTAVLCNIAENIGVKRLKELGYSYKDLNTMNLKQLENLYKQYAPQESPLNVMTWIKNHSRISSSGKLIGVFASLSSTHPYFQIAEIKIAATHEYVLGNNDNQSFKPIHSNNGTTISKLMSSLVNSSVDDVKYPTLADCNINMFTAAIVNVMSMKGDNIKDIGIFLHQPAVKEMCKIFFGTDELANNKKIAIDTVISQYASVIKSIDPSFNLKTFIKTTFDRNATDLTQMFEDISTDVHDLNYYVRQLNMALLFKNIFEVSNDVLDLNTILRVDTRGGGAGPTIADTMRIVAKARKVLDSTDSRNYTLLNVDEIINLDLIGGKDFKELRQSILNSKLPMVQAAFTLGVEVMPALFKNYLPYLSDAYHNRENGVISKLNDLTKTGTISAKLENRVYLESVLYLLTGNMDNDGLGVFDSFTDSRGRTFKVGDTYNGKVLNSADMIGMWLYEMPKMVQEMKYHTTVEKNLFLRRFYVDSKKSKNAKAKVVPVIKFRGVGNNAITKQKIMAFWESAVLSQDSIVANYAKQLFFYAGLTNAFDFGPFSWSQLASSILKKSVDYRYVDTLRSMSNGFTLGKEFYDMFVRNHLHEREIAPLLDSTDFDVKDSKTFKDSFFVSVSSIVSGKQKQIIVKENRDAVYLHHYIAFTNSEDNSEVYYELQEDGRTYKRIYPLGVRNKIYVYNKTHGDPVTMEQLVNATSFKPATLQYRIKSDNTAWSERVVEYTPSLTRENARKDTKTLYLSFEGNSTLNNLPEENSINLLVYPNRESSSMAMIRYHLKEIVKAWNSGKYLRIALPSTEMLNKSKIYNSFSEETKVFLQQKLNGLSDWIDGLTKTSTNEEDERREAMPEQTSSNNRVDELANIAKKILTKSLQPKENDQNLCIK